MQRLRFLPSVAGEKFESLMEWTRNIVYYSIVFTLTASLLVSVSSFMYGTFYFAFVPYPAHKGSIFPVFEPCKETPGRCGFLNGSVPLSSSSSSKPKPLYPVLMSGQSYTVSVVLAMPESPTNRQLGMFMNCLQLKSADAIHVRENCKSTMLAYRSELLRVLETFVFSPFLLSGRLHEKQTLYVEFFSDFVDDPLNPAAVLDYQVMSRFAEVYSVEYQIFANFSGLRYLMFHYPMVSAVVGISCNLTFLCLVILCSSLRFFSTENEVNESTDNHSKPKKELEEEKEVESTASNFDISERVEVIEPHERDDIRAKKEQSKKED